MILKLKEDLQAKTKVIEKISRNYRRIETKYSKLQANYEDLLQQNRMQVDDPNETFEEEDKDNVSVLKTENQLLRELNTELKHENLLLNEMVTKEKERPSTYKEELTFPNVQAFNNNLQNSVNLILCVNIRSLDANLPKLISFIESLKVKPSIIICTETRNLQCPELYNVPEYKIYYNESKINICDGVVTYIHEIVYCVTRGENELFLARVRCSARVGVEGAAGARDIDEC